MRTWIKISEEDIKAKVFDAISKNIKFRDSEILGIPASYLDEKIFSQDAAFLKDMPFVSTLVQNPNHIGCHTLGNSIPYFSGTQELERQLIEICGVDILKGQPGQIDGYVAGGGTEANIQAIWIYRNYFINEYGAKNDEICIVCSADSHYSFNKAANLLSINIEKVGVEFESRLITTDAINKALENAVIKGAKYIIVGVNMMTTMFGSVDNPDPYIEVLLSKGLPFKMHVDGAYGGFYFPFSSGSESRLTFGNEYITSFTLDAHKMAQAPYGTGIFVIRKNYIQNVYTKEASYVEGEDYTLSGSRSGANAIAVWMILSKYGPNSWYEKILILQNRADWICSKLSDKKTGYYRHPMSNILTIQGKYLNENVIKRFGLVPDNHHDPLWYKIVIMEHVTIEKLEAMLSMI
jgi:tyrosine decarboxylase / aspartate 1-decarboxylase